MSGNKEFCREIADHCAEKDRIEVCVVPKASRNKIKIEGRDDGTAEIKVYVTAAPEDGRANKAVIALLAEALDLPKSALDLVRGESSRRKIIAIRRP